MNKAILISLAAVVVLIVIIALAALRFLRADDADPFDEAPDELRRQPGRAHDETRERTAEPAVAGTRRSAGRTADAEDAAWTGGRSDRGDRAERADRPERSDRPGRDSGFRERSTQDRPAEPDRRAGQGSTRPQPVPAAARAAKAARSDRAAAKASDGPNWDTMSDVDYWTELAADKPFAAEAAPSPASVAASRRSPEQATGARSAARGEPRGDQGGALPTRQSRSVRAAAASAGRAAEFAAAPTDSRPAHAPGRYAAEPATESIAALARLANQGPAAQPSGGQPRNSQPHSTVQRPAGQRPAPQRELLQREAPQREAAQRPLPPRGAQLPAAPPHTSQPRQQVRPLPPAPLDDDPLTSPSFPAINTSDSRSYRTTGRADTPPGGSRSIPAYSEPTQQFTAYPDVPPRSSSAPNGYPVQPATPTGNPYGSFVAQPAASAPQPPAPAQDPGYSGYNHQPAPAASADSWYGAPVPGSAPVPPARHQAPGDYLPGGMPASGYDQAAYPAQPEAAGYQQAGYGPGISYEQGGYGAQDGAYNRESYQGYPGYGAGGY